MIYSMQDYFFWNRFERDFRSLVQELYSAHSHPVGDESGELERRYHYYVMQAKKMQPDLDVYNSNYYGFPDRIREELNRFETHCMQEYSGEGGM